MPTERKKMIYVPRFNRIPFLVHGFGDASWSEADLKKAEELKHFHPIVLRQVHSDIVQFVDSIPQKNLKGDAVVTGLPGILLIVKTADCLPVLLVDPGRRVVAAVHCGWKGTLARLLEKAVAVMSSRCSSHPASLLAALGPCIGADCYEVGPEVREHFLAAGFPSPLFRSLSGQRSRYLFDLRGANLYVLRRLGVPAQKIFSANVCTHCAPRLPSYRRDRQKAGRMLSFIGISV